MKKVLKLFFLDILWLVFSLPLVTIGASTCAAFYVSMKIVNNEDVQVFKSFLKGFKTDFKQGTILWAFTAVCIYVLWIMWNFIKNSDDISWIWVIGAICFTALIIFVFLYAYPVIARYDNSFKKIIRNSLGISLQYFRKTMIVIALVAVEILIFIWNKWTRIAGLLIAPELVIYTISYFAKQIFNNLEEQVKKSRAENSQAEASD